MWRLVLTLTSLIVIASACSDSLSEDARSSGTARSPVSRSNSIPTPTGPLIVSTDAAMFAPSLDYFGLGWIKQEPTDRQGDDLLSRHIASFANTQPVTGVTVDVAVYRNEGLAAESYAREVERYANQGKENPEVGETAFRVRTEHLALLKETLVMRRRNVIVSIDQGRGGF